MKSFNPINTRSALALTAAILAAGTAAQAADSDSGSESERAESTLTEAEPQMTEEQASLVSGTLTLSVNTHFISYGADVWADGQNWNDLKFNPSLELGFDLGKGFTAIVGTWWDVNNGSDSVPGNTTIGSNYAIQEVDVWAGLSYAYEKWSFTVLYQDWMYAGQDEQIVDGIVGYDHWLSPKLVIHGRVGNGFSSEANGVVGVVGIAPSKEFGIVTLSVPVNLAVNTENFHGGDGGFTFFNLGVGASVPLEFMPGDWSASAGLTYWHTPSSTVPNNPETDFVTGSIGLALAF